MRVPAPAEQGYLRGAAGHAGARRADQDARSSGPRRVPKLSTDRAVSSVRSWLAAAARPGSGSGDVTYPPVTALGNQFAAPRAHVEHCEHEAPGAVS
jgi:hypothetical protein